MQDGNREVESDYGYSLADLHQLLCLIVADFPVSIIDTTSQVMDIKDGQVLSYQPYMTYILNLFLYDSFLKEVCLLCKTLAKVTNASLTPPAPSKDDVYAMVVSKRELLEGIQTQHYKARNLSAPPLRVIETMLDNNTQESISWKNICKYIATTRI